MFALGPRFRGLNPHPHPHCFIRTTSKSEILVLSIHFLFYPNFFLILIQCLSCPHPRFLSHPTTSTSGSTSDLKPRFYLSRKWTTRGKPSWLKLQINPPEKSSWYLFSHTEFWWWLGLTSFFYSKSLLIFDFCFFLLVTCVFSAAACRMSFLFSLVVKTTGKDY